MRDRAGCWSAPHPVCVLSAEVRLSGSLNPGTLWKREAGLKSDRPACSYSPIMHLWSEQGMSTRLCPRMQTSSIADFRFSKSRLTCAARNDLQRIMSRQGAQQGLTEWACILSIIYAYLLLYILWQVFNKFSINTDGMNDQEYIFTIILITIYWKLLALILTLLLRQGGPEVLKRSKSQGLYS